MVYAVSGSSPPSMQNLHSIAMEINRELSKRQFMQKENDYHHSPYETELEFYSAVREGDLETVKRLYTPLDTNGKGRLSKDKLRNVKYHLVITIAFTPCFLAYYIIFTDTSKATDLYKKDGKSPCRPFFSDN